MASDINRVVLVGRLTRDPELKSTNSGSSYCRFTLASNRSFYKKETSETKEEVGFFDCVAWNRAAEIIVQYLHKGSRIGIDGSLRFSSWEDAEGKKHSKVEIFVDNFQFLESKSAGSTANNQNSGTDYGTETNYPSEISSSPMSQKDFGADDVPF